MASSNRGAANFPPALISRDHWPVFYCWLRQSVSHQVVLAVSAHWPLKSITACARETEREGDKRDVISHQRLIIGPMSVAFGHWTVSEYKDYSRNVAHDAFLLCVCCVCVSRPALCYDGREGGSCHCVASLWCEGMSESGRAETPGGAHTPSGEGHLDPTRQEDQLNPSLVLYET